MAIVLVGSERSAHWTREGQVGRAGMVALICLMKPEQLDAAFTVIERHIGVVSISDCEALRAEQL